MCDTSNALYVLVLWKQPSIKQTSETVSAKRPITQIMGQWVPGSWAGVRYYFDPLGPSDTESMWPRLYHVDVDGRNYWLTNTNPNLTL